MIVWFAFGGSVTLIDGYLIIVYAEVEQGQQCIVCQHRDLPRISEDVGVGTIL